MKIALLAQSYPPMVSGAAFAVQTLATEMARRGHEVLVVAASERPYAYSENRGSLTVHRVHSHHNPSRVGQRFAAWPYASIATALEEFKPDVIHLHDPFQFAFAGIAHARRNAIPLVLTIHQLPWFVETYFPRSPIVRKFVSSALWTYSRWLLSRMTAILTPTRTIARVVADRVGYISQVIGYGLDTEVFHPGRINPAKEAALRCKMGIPKDVPIILHVGRLDIDKQVSVVIQAAAKAMQHNQAHLLVVGDGTQKDALKHLCSEVGIAERSHFPGYVTVEQGLADIYRLATLFVTASEIETQGIVLLEAGASGLPIAAVEATCIPEIVHNNRNGWLARPGDINGLAACMNWLLEEPARAKAMGAASRRIMQKFTIEKSISAYETLYRSACSPAVQPVPIHRKDRALHTRRA